jgi:hypothetical protein
MCNGILEKSLPFRFLFLAFNFLNAVSMGQKGARVILLTRKSATTTGTIWFLRSL